MQAKSPKIFSLHKRDSEATEKSIIIPYWAIKGKFEWQRRSFVWFGETLGRLCILSEHTF